MVRGEKHNRSSLSGTWWVSNYKHSGFGRGLKLTHPLIECFGGVLDKSPRKKTPSWKFIQRQFIDELSRNALEGSKSCRIRQTERLNYDAVATKIWVDLASRLDFCIPTFFSWTSSSRWSVPAEEEWLWVRQIPPAWSIFHQRIQPWAIMTLCVLSIHPFIAIAKSIALKRLMDHFLLLNKGMSLSFHIPTLLLNAST